MTLYKKNQIAERDILEAVPTILKGQAMPWDDEDMTALVDAVGTDLENKGGDVNQARAIAEKMIRVAPDQPKAREAIKYYIGVELTTIQ